MSAKQNLSPPRPRGLVVLSYFLIFLLIYSLAPLDARADTVGESARALARKVWSSIHATTVTCDFRNLSTLRRAEFANLSAAFQEELQRRGVKILPADAAVNLVVSVTQDPAEYIGVVQIQRKESTETVMETIGPVDGPAAPEPAFSLALHREFLFSQDIPIFDVVLDKDGKHADVLGVHEAQRLSIARGPVGADSVQSPSTSSGAETKRRGFLALELILYRAVFAEEILHCLQCFPAARDGSARKIAQLER